MGKQALMEKSPLAALENRPLMEKSLHSFLYCQESAAPSNRQSSAPQTRRSSPPLVAASSASAAVQAAVAAPSNAVEQRQAAVALLSWLCSLLRALHRPRRLAQLWHWPQQSERIPFALCETSLAELITVLSLHPRPPEHLPAHLPPSPPPLPVWRRQLCVAAVLRRRRRHVAGVLRLSAQHRRQCQRGLSPVCSCEAVSPSLSVPAVL